LEKNRVVTADEEAALRYSWDGITIDFPSRTLTISGQEVQLSPTEFDLLWELVISQGAVVTYEQILEKIWGNESGPGRDIVHAYIKRLRSKIEADPHNPRYILLKTRIGYRLAVDFYK
jgi:two-component system, OmpR family, KDP operon response regulator KdpE